MPAACFVCSKEHIPLTIHSTPHASPVSVGSIESQGCIRVLGDATAVSGGAEGECRHVLPDWAGDHASIAIAAILLSTAVMP